MARLGYWAGVAHSGEVQSSSAETNVRLQGISPLSKFYTNFAAFCRRTPSVGCAISYDPLVYSSSTTKTEVYGRFWFQYLTLPVSDIQVTDANWIGGAGHDVFRGFLSTTGTFYFQQWNGAAMTTIGTSAALTAGQWYRIEFHTKQTAAGNTTDLLEFKVDGTVVATSTVTYGGTTIGSTRVAITASATDCYYNIAELTLDDAAYPGNTRSTSLALTGQGTYDQWTDVAGRDWKGMTDTPFDYFANGVGDYGTSTSGNKVSFTIESFASRGITGNLKSFKVLWTSLSGFGNFKPLIRRNGVDTVYTPLGTSYDSILVDASGWATSDTIEIGFQATASVAIRNCAIQCYVEHDTADPGIPTGNMKTVSGTYAGLNAPLVVNTADPDVASLYPDFVMVMRTDTPSSQVPFWWWDANNAPRTQMNSDSSRTALVPIKGGFIVPVDGTGSSINTSGATYSYLALFDPSSRGTERGSMPLKNAVDNTNIAMRNAAFVTEMLVCQTGAFDTTTSPGSYVAHAAQGAGNCSDLTVSSAGFEVDAIQSFGTGTFQVGTKEARPQWGLSYLALRTTQFQTAQLFALGSYTGDGSGARTISVSLGGATPFATLVVHNAARARNLRMNGVCRSIAGVVDTTAITGEAANSFSVHANLNTAGIIYSYLVFAPTALDLSVFGVTAVMPGSGKTAGGYTVGLVGVGFAAGGTFTFGGVPATNVVILSSTAATATVPAHAEGAVTVAYTAPTAVVGGLTTVFTYVDTKGMWRTYAFEMRPRQEQTR